jgi:UDP-GlcNAc:undecaprenyl-phosphate GlcNAc-1-phosphate transferase
LYIIVFAAAFAISLIATPFSIYFAKRVGAIDKPKARGMHKEPIPRMGGIAIVLGFMIAILVFMPFIEEINYKQSLGLLLGAAIIVGLGMLDDIYDLNAKLKFAVQIIAALIAVYFGVRIDIVYWPFMSEFGVLSIPITVLWIVGITNAVNLIDGLDGLAAGISAIAATCLTILCMITGSSLSVFFTVALAGACFGFLPRNFNPAEVIMGDTGSTFLGYILAVTSITGLFKSYAALAIVVGILAIGLPIFDTTFAIVRRLINRKPIMQADRGHLHHRLIDMGYSPKRAVVIMYGISVVLAMAAIIISMEDLRAIGVMLVMLMVSSLMVKVYRKRL